MSTEFDEYRQDLYKKLKAVVLKNGYEFDVEVNTYNDTIYYSTFACTCKEENEKTLTEMFFVIVNHYDKNYDFHDFESYAKVFGYIGLPDQITFGLDEHDMSISYVCSDQWSMMGIDNAYIESLKFSIQYDQMIFGYVHAVYLKLLYLSGELNTKQKAIS